MNRREFLQHSTAATGGALFGSLGGRIALAGTAGRAGAQTARATGPLRVHPDNGRYFADGAGHAVLLTGSHMWNNLVDMGRGSPPPIFNFDAYLDFLTKHRHNFVRLWTWESLVWDSRANGRWSKPWVHTVAPHPWARTGPGEAIDGKPKFDLTKFDPDYFQRLRKRIRSARERGIYVSVMLFEGWAMQRMAGAWMAHPFHPGNSVQKIAGDIDPAGQGLEIHTLGTKTVTAVQEAYVKMVVSTVGDLDNVLYEISNENHSGSTAWQYHMIEYVHALEKNRPKQHPVGMTFQFKGGSNRTLFDSPADWISPNPEGGYRDNPPVADGKKVIVSDTDHLWGIGGNAAWVFKSFFRGLNPIFMDPYDGKVLGDGKTPAWKKIREAMGVVGGLSRRAKLAALTPTANPEHCSTRYCLRTPGREYLTYQPEKGPFRVQLRAGKYRVQWVKPSSGDVIDRHELAVEDGKREFKPPFDGAAVLHLR